MLDISEYPMVEKLFEENYGKASATTKAAILETLGLLSFTYPDAFKPTEILKLLDIFMENLKAQTTAKKVETSIIAGCFKGLAYYLNNFAVNVEQGKILGTIFSYLKTSLDQQDLSRYQVIIDALYLLSRHANLFREYLTHHAEAMFKCLESLTMHGNVGVKKTALPAFEAFIAQVSQEITRGVRHVDLDKKTFNMMFQRVKSILDSNDKTKIGIAIAAFGQLVLPTKLFLGKDELLTFLFSFFRLADQIYTKTEEDMKNSIIHISRFINTFSNIIVELDNVNSVIIEYLARIMGVLLIAYPNHYAFKKYRDSQHPCLMKLFIALFLKKDAFASLLDKIVIDGLMLTISIDGKDPKDQNEEYVPLWKNYSDFWVNIIDTRHIKLSAWNHPWNKFDFPESVQNELTGMIYDKILESILKMLDKLNLSVETLEDQSISPKHKSDYALFLNLVDFCTLFLSKQKTDRFLKWGYLFVKKCIEKSKMYPHVSGFYKMISVFAQVGSQEKLFKKMDNHKKPLFEIMKSFLETTISSLLDKREEILSACLMMIFSMPHELNNLETFVSPLCICLDIGLSYYSLANLGFNTLDRWFVMYEASQLESVFVHILPSIKKYLISKNMNKEFQVVQMRAIKFLGQIGGYNKGILVEKNPVAWDPVKKIAFTTRFQDSTVNMTLDSLLPRVVELALESPDRNIKINAGEFLHSTVIWMVGKSSTKKVVGDENKPEPTQFYNIYTNLFPALLKLAVDSEAVTSQLFSTLCTQLTHWFTKAEQYENKETMSLLNAILEGLVNPTNGGLREFCASLTNEFMLYSAKHTNRDHVKSLLKRLYSHLAHPNIMNRLGAVTAIEKFYRSFREFDKIIEMHVMELTHTLIMSLRMPGPLTLVEKTLSCVKHMERIIVSKYDLFVKDLKGRAHHDNLDGFVRWLFASLEYHEEHCRKACQALFVSLLEVDREDGGPRQHIAIRIAKEGNNFIKKIALNYTITEDIFASPVIKEETKDIWCTELETSLDNLFFLFANKIIVPHQILDVKKRKRGEEENIIVFLHISRYLANYKDLKNKKILLKIFKFISIFLDKFQDSISDEMFDETLMECLLNVILLPSHLGLDTVNSDSVERSIFAHCYETLRQMCKKSEWKTQIATKLGKMVFANLDLDIFSINPSDPHLNLEDARILARGWSLLYSLEITGNVENSVLRLGNRIFESESSLSPIHTLIVHELMAMLFSMKLPVEVVMDWLNNDKEWGNSDFLSKRLSKVFDRMDDSQVKHDLVTLVTKGQHFAQLFETQLFDFFSLHPKVLEEIFYKSITNVSFLKLLTKIPIDVLKKNDAHKIMAQLYSHYGRSTFEFKLHLSKLILRDPEYFASNDMMSVLTQMALLQRSEHVTSLEPKLNAIQSCGPLLLSLNFEGEVMSTLKSIVVNDFPITMMELKPNTVEYSDHMQLVTELLLLLVKSKNIKVFERFFFMHRWMSHPSEEFIKVKFSEFLKVITIDQAYDSLKICLKCLMNENIPMDLRRAVAKRLFKPCLDALVVIDTEPMTRFYEEHIKLFLEIVARKPDTPQGILTCTWVFYLVEMMYTYLNPLVIKDRINTISGFVPTTPGTIVSGKEMLSKLIGFCQQARQINTKDKDYYVYAYRCLIQVIIATQSQERVIKGLLLEDNKTSSRFLEQMIDLEKQYQFDIETNFEKANTKSIEAEKTENKYISVSFASESSLGDISHLSSYYIPGGKMDINYAKSTRSKKEYENPLELDEINATPLMEKMLQLVDFLSSTKVQTKQKNGEMPDWIADILKKFSGYENVPLNLRLFLVKLILNRPKIFNYQDFINPIVEVGNQITNEFHYFTRDICYVLIRDFKGLPDSSWASPFVTKLMKKCNNMRNSVLRSNLIVLRLLVEKWKTVLSIDPINIFAYFKSQEKDEENPQTFKQKRKTGIQLMGLLITNDVWNIDEKTFEAIVDNLKANYKPIYESAAEVAGLALKHLKSESLRTNFAKLLVTQLTTLTSKMENAKLLVCFKKITIHYAPFCETFVTRFIHVLTNLSDTLRVDAIEILKTWPKFSYKHLYPYIKIYVTQSSEPVIQVHTLQLILELVKNMNADDVDHFLSILPTSSEIILTTFNQAVRTEMYKILIWLYDNKEGYRTNPIVMNFLLTGMNDPSQEVMKSLLDFWNAETRLSTKSDRLEQLFTTLFHKNLESNWIKYSAYLLLSLVHFNTDFTDPKAIFAEKLSDCEFVELKLDVGMGSLPQTPLFSATLTESFVLKNKNNEPDESEEDKPAAGEIMATQNPMFSQTQSSLIYKPGIKAEELDKNPTRFKKFDSLSQSLFIERAVRLKRVKDKFAEKMKTAQPTNVKLFRKYRAGEIPDIQVSVSEFIVPLEFLCLSDLNIAQEVMIDLYDKIIEKNKMEKIDGSLIQNILGAAKNCTPIIKLLLNILYKNESLVTDVSSEVIKEAALASWNLELGVMVLEKKAAMQKSTEKSQPKAIFFPPFANTLAQLGKIFKRLDFEDDVKSMFLALSRKDIPTTLDAITFEMDGNYRSAAIRLKEGLDKAKTGKFANAFMDEEIDLWKEERLECYKKISQWETIYEEINDVSIWEPNNVGVNLSLYIETLSKVNKNQLVQFLDASMNHADHKRILTNEYPQQLAIASIASSKLDLAAIHVKKGYQAFLNAFLMDNPTLKNEQLEKIQLLVETDDFINRQELSVLKRTPHPKLDSLPLWDDFAHNRMFFLQIISEKEHDKNLDVGIKKILMETFLQTSRAGNKHHNVGFAKTYLERMKEYDQVNKFEFLKVMTSMLGLQATKQKEKLEKSEGIVKYLKDHPDVESLKLKAYIILKNKMEELNINTCELGSKTDIQTEILKLFKMVPSNAKTHFEFGLFAYQVWLKQPNLGLAKNIMTNYLEAMKLGSHKACQRFPVLLEVMNKYPELESEFIFDEIPLEYFMEWISQILANLNEATCELILRLAEKFPQIVFYQYEIVKKDLKFTSLKLKNLDMMMKQLVEPRKLVQQLNLMTFPEHRLKNWAERFTKTPESIKTDWNIFMSDIFDDKSPDVGGYNTKFAQDWIPKFKSKFGANGEKITSAQKAVSDFNNLQKEVHESSKKTDSHYKLNRFSNWLADYKPSSIGTQYIEVPTYDPHHRVKIVGFDQNVMVLASMRKPKRLVMYGSDEKEYSYLVKGGEDVRQDQRIQQLFRLMNGMLKTDPKCREKNLFMRTYDIVPMTALLGLIEWVPNTVTLKHLLEKQLAQPPYTPLFERKLKDDPRAQLGINDVFEPLSTLGTAASKKYYKDGLHSSNYLYYYCLIKENHATIKKAFESTTQGLPKDLLIRSFSSLTQNLESYFVLRNKYIRSISAISICGYVLGIGDRHLENYLLDTSSGEIISIDFGHAFGSATEQLGVPEMIPFRLTRQMTSVLPLFLRQDTTLFSISMEYVMNILQRNKELLLTTMDIFVKEPLVDWAKYAQSVKGSLNLDEDDIRKDTEWYPKLKLETSKKKLELINPYVLVSEEISRNGMLIRNNVLDLYRNIAKGDNTIRSQCGQVCDSVKEQVKCLIDLATDPLILGVSYVGWLGWV